MSIQGPSAVAENPWLAQEAEIEDVHPELPGVSTYRLRFRDPLLQERYQFLPGQFNMLYIPGAGEIAISVSARNARHGTWDHTIRVAGNVTRSLARLGAGAVIGLRGPYGSSWPLEASKATDLILVAGGIGLAPLRPALDARLEQPSVGYRTTLLYGARSPEMLLYTNEFDKWAHEGIELQTTVDRATTDWTGNVGAVPLLVDRLQDLSPQNTHLFLCGPEVMIRYTVRSALGRGLRKDQIWVSLERNMQCAVGLCGHCQLGPAFVCKDGPVFRYDEIEPFLSVEAL